MRTLSLSIIWLMAARIPSRLQNGVKDVFEEGLVLPASVATFEGRILSPNPPIEGVSRQGG